MSEFLDITREEFADYLDYLELYGGETGFIKEYKLTPYSNLPEYCYRMMLFLLEVILHGVAAD